MYRSFTIDAGQWGKLLIDFADEQVVVEMPVPHAHNCWELFCWLGSRMTYYLGDQQLRVPHCTVITVPPRVPHRTKYVDGELIWKLDIMFEEQFWDIFPTEDVRQKIRATLSNGKHTVPVKWANELRHSVIETLLAAENGDCLSSSKAAFAVASILTSIVQAAAENTDKNTVVGMRHSHVAAAMAIIEQEYDADITLKYLSEQLHLTENYICHIFKDILGMPVSQYLRSRRIRASQPLLLNTSASIAEIAEQVGFGCVNYFTKCFRAEEGLTPSRYRALMKKGK